MSDNDILWRVVFHDRDSGGKTVEGLFRTEEEAKVQRDALAKKRAYNDSFDIYPLDNDWEYYVQSVTRREVMEERRVLYEKLMESARERFWSHCDEHFEACCRELLRWLATRIKVLTDENRRLLAKEKRVLYAPWQTFYGEAKVFAFVGFRKSNSLSLTGQFAGESLRGTIYVDIRHFDNRDAFLSWIGDFDDAVAEFVKKMREERCEEYEKVLQLPF